jgi:hypothetical protein
MLGGRGGDGDGTHSGTDGPRHTSRPPVYAWTKQRAAPFVLRNGSGSGSSAAATSPQHGAWLDGSASGAPVRRYLLLLLRN